MRAQGPPPRPTRCQETQQDARLVHVKYRAAGVCQVGQHAHGVDDGLAVAVQLSAASRARGGGARSVGASRDRHAGWLGRVPPRVRSLARARSCRGQPGRAPGTHAPTVGLPAASDRLTLCSACTTRRMLSSVKVVSPFSRNSARLRGRGCTAMCATRTPSCAGTSGGARVSPACPEWVPRPRTHHPPRAARECCY